MKSFYRGASALRIALVSLKTTEELRRQSLKAAPRRKSRATVEQEDYLHRLSETVPGWKVLSTLPNGEVKVTTREEWEDQTVSPP